MSRQFQVIAGSVPSLQSYDRKAVEPFQVLPESYFISDDEINDLVKRGFIKEIEATEEGPATTTIVLTAADMLRNPQLADGGYTEGDSLELPHDGWIPEAPKTAAPKASPKKK